MRKGYRNGTRRTERPTHFLDGRGRFRFNGDVHRVLTHPDSTERSLRSTAVLTSTTTQTTTTTSVVRFVARD